MQKIQIVREHLYEAIGAGFSMSGSGFRGGLGSTSRGGFGGAGNMGRSNTMYTYEIKPLNNVLEQPPTPNPVQLETIKIGSKIVGTPVMSNAWPDNKKKIAGIVNKIEQTDDGAIKYYVIQDEATQTPAKIEPLSAKLLINEPVMYYSTYKEALPSRRKEKIKRSLKEGKIVREHL